MIQKNAPPEDLPEFAIWIPGEEVVGEADLDDNKEDDGMEAPRRTGLTLVNPADLRGHRHHPKQPSTY